MRKTTDITITADGRDNGKTFVISEMAAVDAERWATRALFTLSKSGANLPPEILAGGMASFASISGLGLQALIFVSYEEARPLLDDLMKCVKIREPSIIRALTPDDIEEIGTFFQLREEALKLHLGFFVNAGRSTSISEGTSSSAGTQTSPPQSERPSPQERQH